MTLFLLLALVLLAMLAPRYGVDSRDLETGPDSSPARDKLWSRQP